VRDAFISRQSFVEYRNEQRIVALPAPLPNMAVHPRGTPSLVPLTTQPPSCSAVRRGIERIASALKRAIVGALLTVAAVASQAQCSLRALELPVEMINQRAVVTVSIDGTPVRLLVDTGAFYSSLTPETARRLHLEVNDAPRELSVRGVTGRVDVRLAKVKHLRIQGGEIPAIDFLVGGHIAPGTMGILGRNILSFEDTEFDLAHQVIRLVGHTGDCTHTNLAYWANGAAVSEVRLSRADADFAPAILAPARVNGQQIQVQLDSGATSLISLDTARRLGLRWDADHAEGELQGLGEKTVPYWSTPVDAFELAGEEIRNTSVHVAWIDPDGIDMLLGIEFFLSHRIIVSPTSRRMFFTYNGGKVFGLEPDRVPPHASSAP
jgi:predicted aspartyl protease